MNYHIHVHSLVTYGGLTKVGEWKYPKEKNKIEKYRKICSIYKRIYLDELKILINKKQIKYHTSIEELIETVEKLRWVVHSTRPTMNSEVIENYLARYINRIAISPSRLQYVKEKCEVNVIHNDYKNQKSGEAAPKQIKNLKPLEAIYQILQHTLPAYFQKSRCYGLHNSSTKIQKQIPSKLKRNGITIRTIFEIITHLLQLDSLKCEHCGSLEFVNEDFKPDYNYILKFISPCSLKSPPQSAPYPHISSHTVQTVHANILSGIIPFIP
jgi:hypothetical protein